MEVGKRNDMTIVRLADACWENYNPNQKHSSRKKVAQDLKKAVIKRCEIKRGGQGECC